MKARINEIGDLIVLAENSTEEYALTKWWDTNIHPCTLQFKSDSPRCFYMDRHLSLDSRIKRFIKGCKSIKKEDLGKGKYQHNVTFKYK